MTQTNFVFSYTEKSDFKAPLEISMTFPERSIDEMCEFFQRFLLSTGYLFENNEAIGIVKRTVVNDTAPDVITFNDNGTPFVYDFGDDYSPYFVGSHVRGGCGDDIISLG